MNKSVFEAQKLSLIELADAGFFATGLQDEVICSICSLGLRDWQTNDQPIATHLELSCLDKPDDIFRSSCKISTPFFSCPYILAFMVLQSELPMKRKISQGSLVKSLNNNRSGVIDAIHITDDISHKTVIFPSYALQLTQIYEIMNSESNSHWAIINSRMIGHQDDLIILALWSLIQKFQTCFTRDQSYELPIDLEDTNTLLREVMNLEERIEISSAREDDKDNETETNQDDPEFVNLMYSREFWQDSEKKLNIPPFKKLIDWWYQTWVLENVTN